MPQSLRRQPTEQTSDQFWSRQKRGECHASWGEYPAAFASGSAAITADLSVGGPGWAQMACDLHREFASCWVLLGLARPDLLDSVLQVLPCLPGVVYLQHRNMATAGQALPCQLTQKQALHVSAQRQITQEAARRRPAFATLQAAGTRRNSTVGQNDNAEESVTALGHFQLLRA